MFKTDSPISARIECGVIVLFGLAVAYLLL
jgi:hypothetical protein